MKNLLTQVSQPIGNLSGIGNIGNPRDPVATLAQVLSSIIGFLTIIAALFFIFNIMMGGIQIITAGGDKNAVEEARRKLSMGVVGLIIVISAMFIIGVLLYLLGISDILDLAAVANLIQQR